MYYIDYQLILVILFEDISNHLIVHNYPFYVF